MCKFCAIAPLVKKHNSRNLLQFNRPSLSHWGTLTVKFNHAETQTVSDAQSYASQNAAVNT